MGTRSDIIVEHADGKFKRIYCHWDGYLEGVGQTLFSHYNSQERAEAVVAPGDMSSLAERCDGEPGHSFDNNVKGQTVYYGRDRGETEMDGVVGDTLVSVWPSEGTWTEFTYVWTQGRWWVADADEGSQALHSLEDALKGDDRPTPLPWVIPSRDRGPGSRPGLSTKIIY
jgi:hypothetical protein